ncbi:hypothetical protein E2562_028175 [Oryza meyeriana var. granulata]|uniref:Uncharacterized protein n=1 Tax=Oryza meyeriana var. granulata TaxID=110450 RepID=A0A6G1CSK5_9ORYZ|nr:hypothetical protein E2562_028175 [Oryza meyeriana var. granulata]
MEPQRRAGAHMRWSEENRGEGEDNQPVVPCRGVEAAVEEEVGVASSVASGGVGAAASSGSGGGGSGGGFGSSSQCRQWCRGGGVLAQCSVGGEDEEVEAVLLLGSPAAVRRSGSGEVVEPAMDMRDRDRAIFGLKVLERTANSYWLRWENYLCPNGKHRNFTAVVLLLIVTRVTLSNDYLLLGGL